MRKEVKKGIYNEENYILPDPADRNRCLGGVCLCKSAIRNAGANTSSTSADGTPVSPDGVIAEGHLIPARDTTLSFQGAGTVMDVKAKTGEKVKEGDVLARLGGESDAAYAAAQLELVNAQQALKELQENADAARAQSLITVDNAQEAYDKAVDYYDSLFKSYKYDELVFIRKVTPFGVKKIPEIKTEKSKRLMRRRLQRRKMIWISNSPSLKMPRKRQTG